MDYELPPADSRYRRRATLIAPPPTSSHDDGASQDDQAVDALTREAREARSHRSED